MFFLFVEKEYYSFEIVVSCLNWHTVKVFQESNRLHKCLETKSLVVGPERICGHSSFF